MTQIADIAAQFAALAETTRLRLLVICRDREMTVGQLAEALNLPEPAISRHLATLSRAGFLTRERQGREVRYQWSATARSASWLSQALAPVLEADATVRRDQARLKRLRPPTQWAPFVADSTFGVQLAASLRLLANHVAAARALALDVSHGPVLRWLQTATAELFVTAADSAQRHAIANFMRANDLAFSWAANEQPSAQFDLLCVMEPSADALQRRLVNASQWLVPQGRVLVGLPYDALEQETYAGAAHPLFRLRAILTSQGFACERLLPLEAAGEHWLLASGPYIANSVALTQRG